MAKTRSARVTIDAPPAEVWAVLCDVGRWPEWRRNTSRATGTIQVGGQVVVANVIPSSGRTIISRYRVVAVQPEAELRMRNAVGAEAGITLSPIDPGTRTEVVQSSTTPGYLAWLGWLAAAARGKNWAKYVQTRLDKANQALKHHTEQTLKHRTEHDPGTT